MKLHLFVKNLTALVIMMFVSLCFIQTYAFDSTVNLAVGKPAVARDAWTGDGGIYTAAKAVDGNLSTSWMAAVDAGGNGSWLYVDLQNNFMVNKVVIAWNNNRWPSGVWYIQVATNQPDAAGNSNWVNVYTGNAGSNVVAGTGTYTFTATTGRYVRMLGASQATSYGYHINEMKVYSDCATSQGAAPSIAIFPSSTTVMVSQSFQFQSSLIDVNGAIINDSYSPVWGIQGSPSGATINLSTGAFLATQTGTYTVTCNTTYNSISLSTSVTVTVIPFDGTQNLALYKTTSAGGGTAGFAVDNNTGTMWQTDPIANEWWIVDLGGQYNLTNIELVWESAYAKQFDIYTSLTGTGSSDWTLSKSINRTLSSANNYVESIALVSSARYVKFVDKERALPYGAAIREFRVFGSGYYIPVPDPVLTSVTINPASVIPGSITQLIIVPKNQLDAIFNGSTIGVVVTNNDDSPTTGATITNNGDGTFAVNGVTQGTYKLTATATKDAITVTGTATLTVTEVRRVVTINLTTPLAISKYATNRAYDLTVSCLDQYGSAISPTIVWDIQGAAGGSVTNNKYTAVNKGTATIKATSTTSAGTVQSSPVTFDVFTNAANVALNKPVTSISTATGGSNAVDTNIATQWIVPDVPGANNVYDAWLIIDLQANYIIELIDVIWEGAYSKTFTVDYSTNGVDFTTKYNGSNSGGTVTKYNQFYADPSTSRYIRIHSTEAGSGYGTKILDVYINGVDASAMNHYRSTGSGNWADLATWETSADNTNWTPALVAPSSYANSIEIQNNQSVTLNDNVIASSLLVNPRAKLTLNSGKSLTATTLTLNSDASGTATYVDNGTTTITTANVQQYLASGRNWYISSPVSNAKAKTGYTFYKRDEANNAWPTMTTGDGITTGDALNVGQGYIANLASGSATYTFTGTLNTGNPSITVYRTGTQASKPGFNLVGNPYPSYLNARTVVNSTANLEKSIWYRTQIKNSSSYTFDTYNSAGNVGTNNSNNNSFVIGTVPPMQAFWVRVAEGQTSATLNFSNSYRTHATDTVNLFKSKAMTASEQKVLRLQVSNDSNKDEAVIYFDSNASNAYDAYDSPKMSNVNAAIPEIFTVAGTEQVVINGLNSIASDEELPLGFTTGQSNTFSIKATELSNFETGTNILLRDKVLNTEQDITDGSAYTFTSDATTANTSRFSLVFKAPSITTGLNAGNTDRNISVYRNANNQITVNSNGILSSDCVVTVCNIIGQKLVSKNISGKAIVLDSGLSPGVYLVSVTANGKSISKKIILN